MKLLCLLLFLSCSWPEFDFKARFSRDSTVLDSSGAEPRQYGGLAATDEILFASDAENHSIRRISSNGGLMGLIEPDPPFQNPLGLALNAKRLAVVDGSAHKIRLFDLSGQELGGFGERGTGGGQFYYPKDIAFSEEEKLWIVSDYGNRRIQAFLEDGTFAHLFVYRDPKTGQLSSPRGIAVKGKRLYAAYPASRRVVIHRLDGIDKIESEITHPRLNHPQAISAGPSGLIFVSDQDGEILILSESGEVQDWISLNSMFEGEVEPQALLSDPLGTLYIADSKGHRVLRIPASPLFQVLEKARQDYASMRFEEALAGLTQLLNSDPEHARARRDALEILHLLTTRAIEEENWDQASQCLNSILKIEPSNKSAVARLRVVRFRQNLPWMQDLLIGASCLIFLFVLLYSLAFPRTDSDVPEELLDVPNEKDPS